MAFESQELEEQVWLDALLSAEAGDADLTPEFKEALWTGIHGGGTVHRVDFKKESHPVEGSQAASPIRGDAITAATAVDGASQLAGATVGSGIAKAAALFALGLVAGSVGVAYYHHSEHVEKADRGAAVRSAKQKQVVVAAAATQVQHMPHEYAEEKKAGDEITPAPTKRSRSSDARRSGTKSVRLRKHEGEIKTLVASTLAAERTLIERAKAALLRKNYVAAQRALSDHRRSFRAGLLAQERDALRVRLAIARGDADTEALKAAFKKAYPGSVFRFK